MFIEHYSMEYHSWQYMFGLDNCLKPNRGSFWLKQWCHSPSTHIYSITWQCIRIVPYGHIFVEVQRYCCPLYFFLDEKLAVHYYKYKKMNFKMNSNMLLIMVKWNYSWMFNYKTITSAFYPLLDIIVHFWFYFPVWMKSKVPEHLSFQLWSHVHWLSLTGLVGWYWFGFS